MPTPFDRIQPYATRRGFLQSTAATALAAPLVLPKFVHAAGSDLLRVGLVGCGGRGTGAAAQALRADPNVRLTALADAFPDHLERSLAELLQDEEIAAMIDVPPERRFVGFDAYAQLLASGVDVVLLATPPHFRPRHLRSAIEAGKHVFAEKPVAVDAPGVRSVLESCRLAQAKGLSVVSGLCLRYSEGFREAVARILDGAIGEIVALQANDYRGPIWDKQRRPEWSDMEWQMRNWYYYTWLSGDFNVEQHVHFLDVCAWLAGDRYPARATGTGGRQARTGPEFGHIYDHFAVTYEYSDGPRLYSTCRQIAGCSNDMSVQVLGTKGRAHISERKLSIESNDPSRSWIHRGKDNNFYQTEHDELFASIRQGKPLNNGDYMAHSTLLAIQGRMSAYTGKTITWEQALASTEDLTPPNYEWGALPEPRVAIPGV
ncbi:MAG: Gfo/Idh/MocA family protein [Planctomycetales bacterium]